MRHASTTTALPAALAALCALLSRHAAAWTMPPPVTTVTAKTTTALRQSVRSSPQVNSISSSFGREHLPQSNERCKHHRSFCHCIPSSVSSFGGWVPRRHQRSLWGLHSGNRSGGCLLRMTSTRAEPESEDNNHQHKGGASGRISIYLNTPLT